MQQLGMFGESFDCGTPASTSGPSAQQGFMFADQLEETCAQLAQAGQIKPAYAAILATSGLDKNQQYIALQRLSARPMSTKAFSLLCADILSRGNAPLTPMLPGQIAIELP